MYHVGEADFSKREAFNCANLKLVAKEVIADGCKNTKVD